MDLNLYARVLWRFRVLVVLGFIIAIAATFLAMVRVSTTSPHFVYRKPVKWQSTAVLFASPAGYPWKANQPADTVDPGTFALIASNFATGDQVLAVLRRQGEGKIDGKVEAIAENDGDGHTLPFVDVTGIATSPQRAVSLANRAAVVLKNYVVQQQNAQNVQPSQRIGLRFVSTASKATVSSPRGKALPALVFILIMGLTIGAAFALENVRPQPKSEIVEPVEPVDPTAHATDVRLTA